MATNSTPTNSEVKSAIYQGIAVEYYAGLHNTRMVEAVDQVIARNNSDVMQLLLPQYNNSTTAVHERLLEMQRIFHQMGHEQTGTGSTVAYTVMTSVAMMFVITRLWIRTRAGVLRLEDYLAITALSFLTATYFIFIFSSYPASHGGQHMWDLTYNELVDTMRLFFSGELMFVATHFLARATLLAFYLTLSTGSSKRYRMALYVLGIYIAMISLATFFAIVFRCKPIDSWNHLVDPNLKCPNEVALYTFNCAGNITGDFFILILPLAVVWRLKLTTREKITLSILFLSGILIVAAAFMRLIFLQRWLKSPDALYGGNRFGIISFLEMNVILIVSSLPAIYKGVVQKRGETKDEKNAKAARNMKLTSGNFAGVGRSFLERRNKKKGITDTEIIADARKTSEQESEVKSGTEEKDDDMAINDIETGNNTISSNISR